MADEGADRRRPGPLAKATAAGSIGGAGMVLAVMLQIQAVDARVLRLEESAASDRQSIAAMLVDVRGMSRQIEDAIAASERRVGAAESRLGELGRDLSALAARSDAARADLHSQIGAQVGAAESRLREELRAAMEAYRVRYAPAAPAGEGRIVAIARALALVDPGTPALWTEDGRPTVMAARVAYGGPVSAAEVSQAWALLSTQAPSAAAVAGDGPR